MKVTSQLIGSLDQEENLRELLGQMSEEDLKIFFKALNLNERGLGEIAAMETKDIMIEILVEDFTRY